MTVKEIRDYLVEHSRDGEIVAMLKEFAPALSADQVERYLDSDEGFSAMRPRFDRYAQKAITTHDEKRKPEIDRAIQEAIDKAKNEGSMSAQERIQAQMTELQNQIKQRDADLARRDMIGRLRAKAGEMNVPLDIAVDLDNPALTEERAIERMTAYARVHADQISAEVNKRLVSDTHKPGTGNGAKPDMRNISKLSFDELVKLEESGELNARIGA